jgi:hypothetical protein
VGGFFSGRRVPTKAAFRTIRLSRDRTAHPGFGLLC